jgi:hypothetical protein
MTDELLRAKLKDALAATDGDKHDAQKLVITWAVRDPQLLLAVTKPHLKAIVAGLVDHAARTKDSPRDAGPDNFSRTAIDDIVASASKGQMGDKRRKSNVPPPKATERQANTMRKLAAAFTRNKKK